MNSLCYKIHLEHILPRPIIEPLFGAWGWYDAKVEIRDRVDEAVDFPIQNVVRLGPLKGIAW
jgi:hypothetical protein